MDEGGIKAMRVYKGTICIYLGSCFILKSGREKGRVPDPECGQKILPRTSNPLSSAT